MAFHPKDIYVVSQPASKLNQLLPRSSIVHLSPTLAVDSEPSSSVLVSLVLKDRCFVLREIVNFGD